MSLLIGARRTLLRSPAIAAASFSPADISGLYVWLRADLGTFQDAGVTAATASDDPIGRWADQSGNARHFNQTTAASKPALQTNVVNGASVVRFFEGSGDSLIGPDFSALTAAEVFIVVKIDTDPPGTEARSGCWNFGTSGSDSLFPFTDGVIYDAFGTSVRKTTVNPTPSLASWRLYNVRTASGAWSNHLDGTQLSSTGTNTVAFPATTVIGESVSTTRSLDGDVAEFILYDAVLSGGNRTSIHTYIAARYALTIA